MQLRCIYSQQFEQIYNLFFEPSLRAVSPDIQIVPDVIEVEGNGNFLSRGFNQALIYKWKRALEALYESQNEIILLTDVDIVFNRPFLPEIIREMEDADLAITREAEGDVRRYGLNVGVLALRSVPLVRRFVSTILDEMILRSEWDQLAFNMLLPKARLNYRILPLTFANGRIPYTKHSVLYHATCTIPAKDKTSLALKVEALSRAQRFFAREKDGCDSSPEGVSYDSR